MEGCCIDSRDDSCSVKPRCGSLPAVTAEPNFAAATADMLETPPMGRIAGSLSRAGSDKVERMRGEQGISIWFFIGTLLAIYGVLVLAADFWAQIHPPQQTLVLGEYRAGLWWGLLLLALGILYCVKFRPRRQ
jgi:hypothetical protein